MKRLLSVGSVALLTTGLVLGGAAAANAGTSCPSPQRVFTQVAGIGEHTHKHAPSQGTVYTKTFPANGNSPHITSWTFGLGSVFGAEGYTSDRFDGFRVYCGSI